MTFKILLRVRYVEHENSLHFKPGMSQHRWLSQSLLLTAAFDRKRLTDGKTRVHVIIGYFVRKYSVWSTRTCSPRFGSRTPIVSSKLRYKRDSSFILEDQCNNPNFCEKKAASTSLDYSWNFTDPITTGLSFGQTDGVTCLAHFFSFLFLIS